MLTVLKNWLASKPRKQAIELIVVHATDGKSAKSSIDWLRKIGFSYHKIIERDGWVTKCVADSRVAYHAGNSYGPKEAERGVSRVQNSAKKFVAGCSVNEYSVGISLANFESRGEKLTPKQVEALDAEVGAYVKAYPTIKWISLHRWVSPGRKQDPAMLSMFDLNTIAEKYGLEVWRP